MKLLQTGDSCAFSFLFTEYSDLTSKPPGYPQVKWCTSMGEFSIYRGEFTYMKLTNDGNIPGSTTGGSNLSSSNSIEIIKNFHYECLLQPYELYVGDESEVVIRIYNTTTKTMSILLDCKNSAAANPSINSIASSKSGSSIRPRLSTTSNISYANILATSSTTAITIPNNSGKNNNTTTNEEASVGKNTISAAVHFSHRGLCFSGLTFTPLGIIESGDFIDVTVTVYATCAGLHDLPTLYLIDSVTSERHPIVSACRILVHDSVEEGMEEEQEEDTLVAGGYEDKMDITSDSTVGSTAGVKDPLCTIQSPLPVAASALPSSTQPTAHSTTTPHTTTAISSSLPSASLTHTTTGEIEVPLPTPPTTTTPTVHNTTTTDIEVIYTPPPSSFPPPALLTVDEMDSRELASTSPGLLESIPPSPIASTTTTPSVPVKNVSADLAKFLEDSAREMNEFMGETEEPASSTSPFLDPSTTTTTGTSIGIAIDNDITTTATIAAVTASGVGEDNKETSDIILE